MNIQPIIEINQPIGTFYITKMNAEDLLKCTVINRRIGDKGIQRTLNKNKVKKIENYCDDPDATFPTPIIVAVDSKRVDLNDNYITFNESIIGEIIDGQHRLKGLEISKNINKFELPVIIMFDLDENEKAYVFSVINSNQAPVSKSLIYDLFELDDKKSAYKTAHDIARALNSDNNSAFKNKLKMLGKKESDTSTLSQGTFVTYLMKLYSSDPDKDGIDLKNGLDLTDDVRLPLRRYFIKDRQDVMYKIIRNYFNAIASVFDKEWNDNKKYIICKSTGYGAFIKLFPYIFNIGNDRKTLDEEFFKEVFRVIQSKFNESHLEFTSEYFPSNEDQQRKLAEKMKEFLEDSYYRF